MSITIYVVQVHLRKWKWAYLLKMLQDPWRARRAASPRQRWLLDQDWWLILGGLVHGEQAGPSEAGGCEQAAGRSHIDRHIVQNRIGYLLLRGERKKRRETEKGNGREGPRETEGTVRI